MSLGWLQLHALGYQDIRLLDGGWGVWDRAFTLPVVKGEEPYDEEFALQVSALARARNQSPSPTVKGAYLFPSSLVKRPISYSRL